MSPDDSADVHLDDLEGQSSRGTGLARTRAQVNQRAVLDRSQTAGRRVFDRAVVGEVEQAHLAAGVGALLRDRRQMVGRTRKWPGIWVPGISLRTTAAEAGCSPSSLSRLERGLVRPRRGLLAALAEVLDPDDPEGFTSTLCEAAGDSLREDTEASARCRQRRTRRVHLERYHRAKRAQQLEDQALIGYAMALRDIDVTPINRGCSPRATAADLALAAATFARCDALHRQSQQMRREAARLRTLMDRRPRPGGFGSGPKP